MIPRFKTQSEKQVEANLKIKKLYIRIVSEVNVAKKNMMIEFFCFLLCLTIKNVLDTIS